VHALDEAVRAKHARPEQEHERYDGDARHGDANQAGYHQRRVHRGRPLAGADLAAQQRSTDYDGDNRKHEAAHRDHDQLLVGAARRGAARRAE
jgi:hypothetical protein